MKLLRVISLATFPSASSINFYNGRFYVIGDDAKQILVLDSEYKQVDSIQLFQSGETRIPKSEKADFEASTIVENRGGAKLLIFGSASLAKRAKAIELSLGTKDSLINLINTTKLLERLQASGIRQVNIEGVATVGNRIVLANRANVSNKANQLIITGTGILANQETEELFVSAVEFPDKKNVIGISGLTYLPEKDVLLFTASTEETASTYNDGKIGDSYIGWIIGISNQLKQPLIKPTKLINLSNVDEQFKGEKIESVCLEKAEGDEFMVHLVSDNDNGKSKIFKLRLGLER